MNEDGKMARMLSAGLLGIRGYHPKLIIFGILLLVFWPNLHYQALYLIDDHELISFLTALDSQGISGFWQRFSDVRDFEASFPRFRPVYYLLRGIEMFMWRDHVSLWLGTRLVIATVFAFAAFKFASKYYSLGFALFFSLVIVLYPAAAFLELYFRLAPCETYAMLFIALLLYAIVAIEDKAKRWVWITLTITALVGIKENFYILIPLQFFGILSLLRTKNYAALAISTMLTVLSLLAVAFMVAKLQASYGLDIYAKPVSTSSRILDAIHSMFGTVSGWIAIAITGVFSLLLAFGRLPIKKGRYVNISFAFIITILLFNIYFYSGIPSIRYAVPFWPIIIALALVSFASLSKLCTEKFPILMRINDKFYYIFFIPFIALLVNMDMEYGKLHMDTTRAQQAGISKLIEKSKNIERIVLNVAGSADYEPIFAIQRYLNYRHSNNPLSLSVHSDPNYSFKDESFSKGLLSTLTELEAKGGRGFVPANNLGRECLEVYFHDQVSPVCKERVLVKYY